MVLPGPSATRLIRRTFGPSTGPQGAAGPIVSPQQRLDREKSSVSPRTLPEKRVLSPGAVCFTTALKIFSSSLCSTGIRLLSSCPSAIQCVKGGWLPRTKSQESRKTLGESRRIETLLAHTRHNTENRGGPETPRRPESARSGPDGLTLKTGAARMTLTGELSPRPSLSPNTATHGCRPNSRPLWRWKYPGPWPLAHGETCEEPKSHQVSLGFVLLREPLQGFIHASSSSAGTFVSTRKAAASRETSWLSPPRFRLLLRRALSIRIRLMPPPRPRRMATALPALGSSPTNRIYASCTNAVA